MNRSAVFEDNNNIALLHDSFKNIENCFNTNIFMSS